MRGSIVNEYKYIRGCMRPEIGYSAYGFVNWPGGTSVITFPDLYLDGVRKPDGSEVPNGTIFQGWIQGVPGGCKINIFNSALGIDLEACYAPHTFDIPYGATSLNIPIRPSAAVPINGYGYGFIDSLTIPPLPFTANTRFYVIKNSGGPQRKICVRMFVNWTGTNDKWAIDYLGGLPYCQFINLPMPGYTHYYCRIKRHALDPTHKYYLIVYTDAGRTIAGYNAVRTVSPGIKSTELLYGVQYADIELQHAIPAITEDGTVTINVTADPGVNVDFDVSSTPWIVDDQSPNPVDYFDLAPYIEGSYRITGTENEAIASKTIQRKVNLVLRNENNIFDYRIFQPAYNPLLTPPALNGPYDVDIYDQTGGVTGGGKKIGNLRAGRFVVVQVGVYDAASATWIWRDKFRGRLGDPQHSRADGTVQMSLDDETAYFNKIKTSNDAYINKTFEYIFTDQAVRRLGFPISRVVAPTTNISSPFVFMPDYGETVYAALIKMAEAVGGKIDLTEDGKIICYSRLVDGDDPYLFNTGLMQDDARTIDDNTADNVVDIQGSTILYNQQIINRVSINSKPYKISQESEKVWKFKAFYDDKLARNTGWLKQNRYFGDVWAQNLLCQGTAGKGPVKSIDRDNFFDISQINQSVIMTISAVPPIAPPGNIRATFTWGGTTVLNVLVAADAETEFDLGTVFGGLSGVWIVLETSANITVNDQAELQIGIKFYADFGSNFRVLPNSVGVLPANSLLTFTIVSSIRDVVLGVPGPLDWKGELISNSASNSNMDRVVMALDPYTVGAANYDTENIFYVNSQTGDAFNKIPILIVNKDAQPRYVNSVEIFGRRIVEQSNMVTDVRARELVINAFGGEQMLSIDNNFFSRTVDAEKMGRFICDNYSAPRDIPQITMKHPRPFLQAGDRVRNINSFNGDTKEYVVNDEDGTYTGETVVEVFKLREADAGNGAYDPANSGAESEVINLADYTKLQETVDVTKGGTSTEVKRDIYNMRGVSYHGRQFNFATGVYTDGPGGPFVAPPGVGGISESYAGELRTFVSPPTVLVIPLHISRKIPPPLLTESNTGIDSYATPATSATSFQGMCLSAGEAGTQNGWFQWIAIGETLTIT